jgi:DNA-binding XRE family transcriptional regulator
MIILQNQRQYRDTKAELARFEEGLIAHDAGDPHDLPPNIDPGMPRLMHDAIVSWIETLREQIEHYEKLRDGRITSREITSLHELPTALIEARIAARLTQRQLAERIGVAEQQIQRWEANGYSGVNLDRLQSIADALGVQIHETITYSSAA